MGFGNENKDGLLEFLIPEIQIYKSIKKYGFMKKKEKVTRGKIYSNQQETFKKETGNKQFKSQSSGRDFTTSAVNSNEMTRPKEEQKKSKVNVKNCTNIFENIRVNLSKEIIGQEDYLDNLCIAFKRPFVAGYEDEKSKNNILIVGNKGTGKHKSLKAIAKELTRSGIKENVSIYNIDLSSYNSETDFKLFLSDLYKGIFEKSDIIAFENYEKCHSSIFNFIQKLMIDGKAALKERYVFQNNDLVEASGALFSKSISEINANSNYIVFISEKSEKDALSLFSVKAKASIGDIIHTGEFKIEDLRRISDNLLNILSDKCKENLLLSIRYDEEIIDFVSEKFQANTGVNSLNQFVDINIYKPLSELKLRGYIKDNEQVDFELKNDYIYLKTELKEVNLKDFVKEEETIELEDIKKELSQIIGLKPVKEYVLSLEENLEVQKRRENAGLKAANVSMHMIFTGNPGTGKTTIARIVAKYLKALGVLSEGQLKEVSRGDLVGQYVGETAKLTSDVINSAKGGVLFIDEAYSLCRDKNDTFGIEAIDTLVKGIEDNRDDLVVILAGYTNEMDEFLKSNSGLKSRFPNIIEFPDYTPEEMYDISLITANSKGYVVDEKCKDALIKYYDKKQLKGSNDSGNGRLVRNVIEAAILNQSKRILKDTEASMDLLVMKDFDIEESNDKQFNLEERLSAFVGLREVKDYIRSLNARLRMQNERKKMGLAVDETQTMHMIFKGNPGTGKTMAARTVADVLYNMGIIKTNKLVETDRAGLVAGFVGQTAIKTTEKVNEALDGVLFIDEAYSLSQGGSNDFGKEAIDTLVKLMDDNRDRLIVILAGYSDDMDKFLDINAGLKSRFPNIIEFKDYSVEELIGIAEKQFAEKGYILDGQSVEKLKKIFIEAKSDSQFGNGRYVRNIYEKAVNNQAVRLSSVSNLTKEDLTTIVESDIERI